MGREPRVGETLVLERLAKKGYHVQLQVREPEEWTALIKADPSIPRSFTQLKKLVSTAFAPKGRPAPMELVPRGDVRGILTRRFEECGETLRSRIFTGLENPSLTPEQRSDVEADMDADLSDFEQSMETDHFTLRWTNSSADSSDNISDSSIVSDTAGFLETAWTNYNSTFGRPPHLANGASKIEVVFRDIAEAGSTTVNGPIELDSPTWNAQPGKRQPTSAHELFHRMQYAYGYRTTWIPSGSFQWFSEGSASWGEVFNWRRVSLSHKITSLFTNPDLNLWAASYRALPFWIFFQVRQADAPSDNPMVSFMQKYEATGDAAAAVAEVIDEDWPANNVYGQMDNFFALFARDRLRGSWRVTGSGFVSPYPTILGPDGSTLEPTPTVTGVPMGGGDTYNVSTAVSAYGSDYYRFSFEPDSDGDTFSFSVAGASGGNYSYYLVWEKTGAWKRSTFPFDVSGSYSHAQTIDLADADSLVLIISGRGTGGTYSLNASIA